MPEELKKADPSQYMEGTVASITDFGAFITVCVWCVYGVCVCVCVCVRAHTCVSGPLYCKSERRSSAMHMLLPSANLPTQDWVKPHNNAAAEGMWCIW